MLVPLYGFLEGDTLGLLVLAQDDITVGDLARKLIASARVRVKVEGEPRLIHRGRVLDPALRVASSGIEALDRLDVVHGARG